MFGQLQRLDQCAREMTNCYKDRIDQFVQGAKKYAVERAFVGSSVSMISSLLFSNIFCTTTPSFWLLLTLCGISGGLSGILTPNSTFRRRHEDLVSLGLTFCFLMFLPFRDSEQAPTITIPSSLAILFAVCTASIPPKKPAAKRVKGAFISTFLSLAMSNPILNTTEQGTAISTATSHFQEFCLFYNFLAACFASKACQLSGATSEVETDTDSLNFARQSLLP